MKIKLSKLFCYLIILLFSFVSQAEYLHIKTLGVKDLPEIIVKESIQTPPLWYATKDGYTVIILSTAKPFPTGMQWRSASLEQIFQRATAIIFPPKAKLKLGFFGRISAVTSAPGKMAYKNGLTLADSLPASAYDDVVLANKRFNNNDSSLLHARPGFAAYLLKRAALSDMHLDQVSPVYAYLQGLGRRNHAQIIYPVYAVSVDNPRDFIGSITGEQPADINCLSQTAHLLAHRDSLLRERAQAWADGEIIKVQADKIDAFETCRASLHPEKSLTQHGVTDLHGHMQASWIAAIDDASQANRIVLAALPFDELIGADGYLSMLRKKGFSVSGPNSTESDDLKSAP
jgi:uncharacterized protein YbaP (TraB family)